MKSSRFKSEVLRGLHQEFGVDRHWGPYALTLAGRVVDFIGNGIQAFLVVDRQVGALGEVLTDPRAVHVLVGATLPGAVLVTEVHRKICGFG